ncbi:NAD(P)/FAD-dependent oxidoreductase [Enterococcus cecorum]|uniref:Aminoacetone oxidase family FAD-binding enzyme n=1 Tax=Enterococcus cecorum TaxID=44008 RepID=A0A1Y4R030_9ENTE|nr:NAD(P)/FAD-dependent oxidoreductase [Enterococcus cecorum]OUQ10897.1 aminoacetone oxidase family FAD-binding enzyme [Enterococcus cecorum]CAI3271758.1 NAD(P)/FAD-dependent oxidoreductase [Enterococcus cecorum]CAI3281666.1 NAD(P)/FAD-dependent oxidoreductase [Enterococcus cecorum]CAI3282802.1 NAD(P)/FAD-dependent oxidoreductase [Enterococcus cecorum]CAI3294515.1 NAD(P)/FAD-dependent oxidoreductase [Enterococcus cecorum]
MQKYDVIVIGGGTSGMMAAISASENGAKVLLIEKNRKFGKKLLMTGGGRCNVTNSQSVEHLIEHIPGNGRFLYSTFNQWNNQDIIQFFTQSGVQLKEEDHGRMFPTTDSSKTIVVCLITKLKGNHVELCMKTTVEKLIHDGRTIQGVRCDKGDFFAPSVIIATGGKTYPSTGATGDGYQLAKQVKHQITPLYPTESPLISEADFIQERTLQGLSLRDVQLTVLNQKGKTVTSHTMDLLFTHFGISGPAALRCSSFVNQLLKKQTPVIVELDCVPELTANQLNQKIVQTLQKNGKKQVNNALKELLPDRLLTFYLERLHLADLMSKQVTLKQIDSLVNLIKSFQIPIIRTFALEKSFVTGGGISLKEINPKTLESKKIMGLYACGEVLDINGYTGGYNITAAFCTGHVAGRHAAQTALWQS